MAIIKNFVGNQALECTAANHTEPIVRLVQSAESMRFQFDMKPDQARELGAALYAMADSLDAEPLTKEWA